MDSQEFQTNVMDSKVGLLIMLVFNYVLSFDGLKTMDAFASYYLVDVKKPF